MNRPMSYIKRTETWDDFPNGCWGDARSPAFGELTDFGLGLASYAGPTPDKKDKWGKNLSSIDDVCRTFARYCEGQINELPWNEWPLALESDVIRDQLVKLNLGGLLTINSQPRVNGVPSSDPVHGWGPDNGWVFQKAYVEFFVSEEMLQKLLAVISNSKTYRYLTFHAINYKGEKVFTNTSGTNALTWGVFPGSEIVQPTVVDGLSFNAWKDEAFALWSSWAHQYPSDSSSQAIIKHIQNNWFLCNIVDNDYLNGNIWAVLDEVILDRQVSNGVEH